MSTSQGVWCAHPSARSGSGGGESLGQKADSGSEDDSDLDLLPHACLCKVQSTKSGPGQRHGIPHVPPWAEKKKLFGRKGLAGGLIGLDTNLLTKCVSSIGKGV